jgi:hypothetical protein
MIDLLILFIVVGFYLILGKWALEFIRWVLGPAQPQSYGSKMFSWVMLGMVVIVLLSMGKY